MPQAGDLAGADCLECLDAIHSFRLDDVVRFSAEAQEAATRAKEVRLSEARKR